MGRPTLTSSPHFVRKRTKVGIVWYVYAWRGGPQVARFEQAKRPKLGSSDWVKIHNAEEASRKDYSRLVGGALTAFRGSTYWADLASSTQRTWGWALDRIEDKWGKVPLVLFDDPRMKAKIVAWRNTMASTPRTADISVSVLSRFLEWATLDGLLTVNVAKGVPTIHRSESRAPIIWTGADLEALKAVAQQPLRDAVDLAVLTGLRRADLVALRWDEVNDLAIHRTAAKRSRRKRFRVTIPRLPQLDDLLTTLRERERKPGVETVLVNSFGKSWTGDGLNSSFHDARKKANRGNGIWHRDRDPVTGEEHRTQKRLHDMRGTFATRIMAHPKAKLTNREVADIMGWSPEQVEQIRKRYVDDTAIVVSITRRLAGDL